MGRFIYRNRDIYGYSAWGGIPTTYKKKNKKEVKKCIENIK